jgi:hypothetical protein
VRRPAAVIVAVALLAGCGGGDDSKAKDPKDALLGYYDAIGAGDVKTACKFTAGRLNARCARDSAILTQDESRRQALAENAHTLFDKAKVVEKGDLACTAVAGVGFDMKKVDGGWKLVQLRRRLSSPRDCTVGLRG